YWQVRLPPDSFHSGRKGIQRCHHPPDTVAVQQFLRGVGRRVNEIAPATALTQFLRRLGQRVLPKLYTFAWIPSQPLQSSGGQYHKQNSMHGVGG
ncbi:MAG TPA: hypothetical protein V6C65_01540, partial [Allocoleopsis sp.]